MTCSSPEVSIVIPNWNGARWLPPCLDSLAAQTFRHFNILCVDNASRDQSLKLLEQRYSHVRVLRHAVNRGFAAAVNAGIRATSAPAIALLNNDTVASPAWLEALVHTLHTASPDVGAVTSMMVEMDTPDRIENNGVQLYRQGIDLRIHAGRPTADVSSPCEVFSPSAGGALYRRSFLDTAQLFDESFHSYLEDVDLGLRGRILGFRYLLAPHAVLRHKGHGSSLPAPRYVRMITRNRFLLLHKNLPVPFRLRHACDLAYGHLYFALAQRRPLQSLAGYLAFLPLAPRAAAHRIRLWQRARISPADLDALLPSNLPLPSLRQALRKSLQRNARS